MRKFWKYCGVSLVLWANTSFAFDYNKASITGLILTYGHLELQETELNYINQKFPDLSNEVLNAKTNFEKTFPNSKNKIREVLKNSDQLNITKLSNLLEKANQRIKPIMDNMSKSEAIKVIQQVNEEAKGNIYNADIAFILAVQYENDPQKELADGFYNYFSSKNLVKANGIDMSFKIPKSWKQGEKDKPNTVGDWSNQNGTGYNLIDLRIYDVKGKYPSISNIPKQAKGRMDDAIINLKVNDKVSPIIIAGQNGFKVTLEGKVADSGDDFYTLSDNYFIFYQGKVLYLECNSGDFIKNKEKVKNEFQKFEPLCESMVNNIVFTQ